jgi:hypothetical protein
MAINSVAIVSGRSATAEFPPRIQRESARIYPLAKRRLKTLYVTSELSDFIQVGGLGAVSASLPRALGATCDIRIVMPGFPQVLAKAPSVEVIADLPGAGSIPPCSIAITKLADGLIVYIVLCAELYLREGSPYANGAGAEYRDNDVRFARLGLAAVELAERGGAGWRPDLLHLNDWPTALASGYLRWRGADTPCLLTIHNLAHQGQFDASRVSALAIPAAAFNIHGVEFFGRVSFLKAGLNYATHVNTVSKSYAEEITRPEFGCGLDGVLRERAAEGRLTGIVNGSTNPGIRAPTGDVLTSSIPSDGKAVTPISSGALSGSASRALRYSRSFRGSSIKRASISFCKLANSSSNAGGRSLSSDAGNRTPSTRFAP